MHFFFVRVEYIVWGEKMQISCMLFTFYGFQNCNVFIHYIWVQITVCVHSHFTYECRQMYFVKFLFRVAQHVSNAKKTQIDCTSSTQQLMLGTCGMLYECYCVKCFSPAQSQHLSLCVNSQKYIISIRKLSTKTILNLSFSGDLVLKQSIALFLIRLLFIIHTALMINLYIHQVWA